MSKRLVFLLFTVAFAASGAFAQTVLTTTLIGPNEPGGGDPDGFGTAAIAINGTQVSFLITEQNLSTITGFHIHDSTGKIVIPFSGTFTNGVATGTVTASQAVIDQILANPAGFFVNVHSSEFGGGAIRGSLNLTSGMSGVATQENPSTCTASDTVLCLNNNRFKLETTFRTATGQTGSGHAMKLTDESGYFWFFEPNNIEVTVKALNACSFSTSQWVFASGMTNVSVTMKVTDTSTGKVRTYANSLGTPFQAIQDTSAFTCP